MALMTCGGADVQRGRIHMPIRGAWWADLVLDTSAVPSGSVTIEADGGASIKGTVQKAGAFLDSVNVRIVGGKGGLAKLCEPRAFQNAQIRDLVGVITDASGDTLSGTVDTALLSTLVSAWSAMQIPAAQALDELCSYAGKARGETINWRYLGDGSLWLGAEAWSSATLPTGDDLLEQDPSVGRQVIGASSPSLLPGVNLDGVGKVLAVDHWIESHEIRTWAWTAPTHLAAMIGDMVRAIVGLPSDPGAPPRIDKLGLYPATVKAASSDGKTLDIQPADSRLSGMQKIPLRVGVPGSVAIVSPGATVLLGWERGDPNKPYCIPAWDAGATVTKLVLTGSSVYIGEESGAEEIPLGQKLLQRIQDIESKHDSHTHIVSGTCPALGGPLAAGLAAATSAATAHAPAFLAAKGKVK